MKITEKIDVLLDEREELNYIDDPEYLLMDSVSYFQLKIEYFTDELVAIEQELESYLGMKVFHNNFGQTYLKIA